MAMLIILLEGCTHKKMLAYQPVALDLYSSPTVQPPEVSLGKLETPQTTISVEKPHNTVLENISPIDIEKARELAKPILKYWNNIDQRSTLVRARILSIIEQMQMPPSLQVIPVIVSAYQPYALSHAGAMGLWQIMPGTARHLGLNSPHGFNARRDVNQSTKAALRYLDTLHKQFNSWPLAFAAYHLGPNALASRLNKSPWKFSDGLSNMPVPEITHTYVAQIIGLASLMDSGDIEFSDPVNTRTIELEAPVDLALLASLTDLSIEQLFTLNPKLDYQQYLKQSIQLDVPADAFESIQTAALSSRPKLIQINIRPGDSWYKLSKSYRTTVQHLQNLNPQTGKVLYTGKLLTVPANQFGSATSRTNPMLSKQRRVYYKVRNGDSLWSIAKRFGTTPEAIAKFNQKHTNGIIRPGDYLWIYAHIQPS